MKDVLLAPFAISPIIGRFAFPGVIAAPIVWAYAVLLFVYCPILLIEGIRKGIDAWRKRTRFPSQR